MHGTGKLQLACCRGDDICYTSLLCCACPLVSHCPTDSYSGPVYIELRVIADYIVHRDPQDQFVIVQTMESWRRAELTDTCQ